MCGIWLQVVVAANANPSHHGNNNSNLSRRGPDHVGAVECRLHNHHVELQSSVLKMRSNSTLQPVVVMEEQESTIYLAWNGEVYQTQNGENFFETVAGYNVADTQLVADWLAEAHARITTNHTSDTEECLEAYASAIANNVMGSLVNSEYAFCIVTPWAIYYGRDPWGRRSLLYWDDTPESAVDGETLSGTVKFTRWKLASVREEFEGEGDNKLWNEVAPGLVHEYRFESGKFRSTQIPKSACPLLSTTPQSLTNKPDNVTESMWKASLALEYWLKQAVQLRVCGTTTTTTTTEKALPPPIPIAVLFSGGVDSVVLAALALQVLPVQEPLRLWNVSFVDQHSGAPTTTAQDCLAAQASYQELIELFPQHTIHLETTEVSWEEMTQHETHIRTLIHPKTTTMDLNIAMALWFASKARCDKEDPRILLVGMGADEQLGGYGRHRKAFERALQETDNNNNEHAHQCLRQELDLDINRLWERNLGRDDRIFSDHGKEARFPYLDPHVTHFLAQTPLEDVCDYSLPPGQGDKRILRLVALRLGLKTASGMVKRAIQFGSRISHVSDKRRFGSRRKAKGTAAV